MLKMGIYKANGQKVVCFSCTQCRKQQIIDFRFYPICKKCNKNNTKMAKRQAEKEKKEENS